VPTVQFLKLEAVYYVGDFVSASLDIAGDWNFRIFDKRLVIFKTKNESGRKVAALDVLTNLSFAIDVPDIVSMQELHIDREYFANLRVYTAKSVEGVAGDFVDFFEALDVNQSMDDFIKAYWVYPNKIRFELIDIEEP
jgi:hypothetical protein